MAVAGILSRVLGAVYRIPLANLIGDEGMGLLELAQPLYNFFLVASVAGLPLAISKLVAERLATGDDRGALRILRVALNIMLVTGLVSSALMYSSADWLASRIYNDPRVALSIRSIAPALFFVTVMSAFRGFFQGLQRMGPSAASQVIEQLVRVATMLVLAVGLVPRGVEYAAAGAALGATAGGMAGLTYLLIMYGLQMRHGLKDAMGWCGPAGRSGVRRGAGLADETTLQIIGRILAISVPVALGASVLPVVRAIDAAIVPARLAAAGFAAEKGTALFGQLNGMAMPLVYFPNVLTIALAASIVPAVSAALARGGRSEAIARSGEAMRLTALVALPAGFGLWSLSSEICALVYGRPEVGRVLASLAPAATFLCILQTSGAILQGMGYPLAPVKSLIAGSIVKVGLEYWLVGIPGLNAVGAGISTSVGFGVVAVMNMIAMGRRLGRGSGAKLAGEYIKPLMSAAIMAGVVKVVYVILQRTLGHARLMTAVSIVIGAFVYFLALIALGGIDRQDFEMIPKVGAPLARVLERIGIVRP